MIENIVHLEIRILSHEVMDPAGIADDIQTDLRWRYAEVVAIPIEWDNVNED